MEDIVYIGHNRKVCSSEIICDTTDTSEKDSAELNNNETLSNGINCDETDAEIKCDSDEACAETSSTNQPENEETVEEGKLDLDNQTVNSEDPNLWPQFQEKEQEVLVEHTTQYIVTVACEDYKFDYRVNKTNIEMLKEIKEFETETVEECKIIFDAANNNNLHQPKEGINNFAEFVENHEVPDETLRVIELNEVQQTKAEAEDATFKTEAANGDDQFEDEIQLQHCKNNHDVENVEIIETEQDEIQKEEEKANGDDLNDLMQEEVQPLAESEEIKNEEKELDEAQEVEDKKEVINDCCKNFVLETTDPQLRDEDRTHCIEEHEETSSHEGKIIKVIDVEFEVDSMELKLLPTNSKTKCEEEQNFKEKRDIDNERSKETEYRKDQEDRTSNY